MTKVDEDDNSSDMKKTDNDGGDAMTDATMSATTNSKDENDVQIAKSSSTNEDDEDMEGNSDEKKGEDEAKEDDGKTPEERAKEEKENEEAEKKRIEELKKKYADWPLRDVKEPHENDVMYGRGGESNTNEHI
jgi:hypothetical protein